MRTRVGIHGVAGRMGHALVRAFEPGSGLQLAAAIERENSDRLGQDATQGLGLEPSGVQVTADVEAALRAVDVVIDFSTPAATRRLLKACAAQKLPAVVGTTGLDEGAMDAVSALAKVAPVVMSPNMSPGVNVLFHLASRAARLLGSSFDVEILEMHHRHKVDAPSGTARRLARAVMEAKELEADQPFVTGREGAVGPRHPDDVGVMSLRGGEVVGDHMAIFAGPGERIELVHRAQDRSIYARGALRAAGWAVSQPPGHYDMADILGVPRG